MFKALNSCCGGGVGEIGFNPGVGSILDTFSDSLNSVAKAAKEVINAESQYKNLIDSYSSTDSAGKKLLETPVPDDSDVIAQNQAGKQAAPDANTGFNWNYVWIAAGVAVAGFIAYKMIKKR